MRSRISPLVAESRLPVGSSAKTTVGRETSARAIATRCCWPPESSAGRWDSRSARPTLSIRSLNHSSSGFSPAIDSGRVMFSSAVSIGSRLKNWKTKPMWRAPQLRQVGVGERRDRRCPRSRPSPLVGLSRPARMCMSVDLPEPDGPMTAVSLPRGDVERDAAQRVHRGVALAVHARDALPRRRRRRPVLFRSPCALLESDCGTRCPRAVPNGNTANRTGIVAKPCATRYRSGDRPPRARRRAWPRSRRTEARRRRAAARSEPPDRRGRPPGR